MKIVISTYHLPMNANSFANFANFAVKTNNTFIRKTREQKVVKIKNYIKHNS